MQPCYMENELEWDFIEGSWNSFAISHCDLS